MEGPGVLGVTGLLCAWGLTVMGCIEALELDAFDAQAAEAVPLAVQHLQPWEQGGVQLRQPVVPQVQLDHVPQEAWLVRKQPGELCQSVYVCVYVCVCVCASSTA